MPLAKYYTVAANGDAAKVVADLNAQGYWLAPLGNNSHPYKSRWLEGAAGPATSRRPMSATTPIRRRIRIPKLMGISIDAYVRNMGILIKALDSSK